MHNTTLAVKIAHSLTMTASLVLLNSLTLHMPSCIFYTCLCFTCLDLVLRLSIVSYKIIFN